MLRSLDRALYDSDHEMFRDSVRKFFDAELTPNMDRWDAAGIIDRDFWKKCGTAGLLCPTVPERYGGPGLDYRYNAIVGEELAYAGSPAGITLHSDIVADYLVHYGTEAQKQRWLPEMVRGDAITAIAMTEPGAGSDLKNIRTTAQRRGESYLINGSKIYITNGQLADLIVVVAKTTGGQGQAGISLILVEGDREGFVRGRNLDKIGQSSSDTSELFFQDVEVPVQNLLGNEGEGFQHLMAELPQERLQITVSAQAGAQRAFDEAVRFTQDRPVYGTTVFALQNTRFALATMAAKLQVGWAHLDWAIGRHVDGKLTADEAAATKLWHTETQWEIVDAALQLHGGAGYMNETKIARLWRDARGQRIYGGSSEVMKVVIARSIERAYS